MRLILGLLFLSCSLEAYAQVESLFPELAEFTSNEEEQVIFEEQPSENASEEVVEISEEEDLFQQKMDIEQPENTPSSEEAPPEEEEDTGEQYILLAVDDIQATLTPNRNASFCSAVFAIANTLKKELKSFTGSFTIGTTTKEFTFSNLKKNQAAASKYLYVGTSCEQILNPPQLNIKTCQVDGWSEKKCKEKVKFIQPSQNKPTVE